MDKISKWSMVLGTIPLLSSYILIDGDINKFTKTYTGILFFFFISGNSTNIKKFTTTIKCLEIKYIFSKITRKTKKFANILAPYIFS